MNVQVINISDTAIKDAVIRALNEVNETSLEVDLNTLNFVSGCDSHLTLLESGTRNGLLTSKIDLGKLFPEKLNLRIFKESKARQQLKSDYEENEAQQLVGDFNKFRNIPLLRVAPEGYSVPADVTEDVVKDFYLFCRVYGFWDLDFQNAIINKQDGVLYISAVKTHPIYTGSLEVLI